MMSSLMESTNVQSNTVLTVSEEMLHMCIVVENIQHTSSSTVIHLYEKVTIY